MSKKAIRKPIYCCGCKDEVMARLTNSMEVYPDSAYSPALPFWKCDSCDNFVGCYHRTSKPTKPLGVIPTPEINKFRERVRLAVNSLLRNSVHNRTEIYARISQQLGKQYKLTDIQNPAEVRRILRIIQGLRNG